MPERGQGATTCAGWGGHCFAEIAAPLGGLKQALHEKIKVFVTTGRFPCAKGLPSTASFEAKDDFHSEQLQKCMGRYFVIWAGG